MIDVDAASALVNGMIVEDLVFDVVGVVLIMTAGHLMFKGRNSTIIRFLIAGGLNAIALKLIEWHV